MVTNLDVLCPGGSRDCGRWLFSIQVENDNLFESAISVIVEIANQDLAARVYSTTGHSALLVTTGRLDGEDSSFNGICCEAARTNICATTHRLPNQLHAFLTEVDNEIKTIALCDNARFVCSLWILAWVDLATARNVDRRSWHCPR